MLPFRVLRPDPETDFLAFSLPDAITTSLSGIGSLVLRSSAVAARFAGEAPDLKALAAEADVDRVVMGTLLRSGDQLRATAQLVEAPGGTLLTSHTVQSSLGDLFRLQDDIARRVVEALSLPLTGGAVADAGRAARRARLRALSAGERAGADLRRARARRATCISSASSSIRGSRRPGRSLGRCHRVIGKYIDAAPDSEARAEDAFRRALALNPRLSLAHKFYANLEADIGQAQRGARPPARRGERATATIRSSSPGSCMPAATAASTSSRSRRTPKRAGSIRTSPTSLEQTLLMTGDIDRLLGDRTAALSSPGPTTASA